MRYSWKISWMWLLHDTISFPLIFCQTFSLCLCEYYWLSHPPCISVFVLKGPLFSTWACCYVVCIICIHVFVFFLWLAAVQNICSWYSLTFSHLFPISLLYSLRGCDLPSDWGWLKTGDRGQEGGKSRFKRWQSQTAFLESLFSYWRGLCVCDVGSYIICWSISSQ